MYTASHVRFKLSVGQWIKCIHLVQQVNKKWEEQREEDGTWSWGGRWEEEVEKRGQARGETWRTGTWALTDNPRIAPSEVCKILCAGERERRWREEYIWVNHHQWRLQREGNVKRHPDITTVQNIWLAASAGLVLDENYREYNSLFPTFYKYIRQGRGNLLPGQKPLQKVILYFITLYCTLSGAVRRFKCIKQLYSMVAQKIIQIIIWHKETNVTKKYW